MSFSRRSFLGALSTAIASSAASGCLRQPDEKVSSYPAEPPEARPGKGRYYATATVSCGIATGVLAHCVNGRPIKIEGHPEHPASLGATGAIEQARLLDLYDPARMRDATEPWQELGKRLRARRGDARLALILEPHSSEWRAHWLQRFQKAWPDARVVPYTPLDDSGLREATRSLFGRALWVRYRLDRADVVLSLGHDFLASGPGWLRYAHDFATRRRDPSDMNRLYVAETSLSVTGGFADHRVALTPGELARAAFETLRDVQAGRPGTHPWTSDLRAHRGRCLVTVPQHASAQLHRLALQLNIALGNLGETVTLSRPSTGPSEPERLGEASGADVIVIAGGDPVRTAPPASNLRDNIEAADESVYLGAVDNATSRTCKSVHPRAHPFETWDVVRALDGTLTAQQPLIQRMYDGHTVEELLALLSGASSSMGRTELESWWKKTHPELPFDGLVERGFAPDSAWPTETVAARPVEATEPEHRASDDQSLELAIEPDPHVLDGRFATNTWLRELPHPITGLSWENAALIGPATAASRHVGTGDVVDLKRDGHTLRIPVLVVPGHAEGALCVHTGYGTGALEAPDGADAFRLGRPGTPSRVRLATTTATVTLVRTQPETDAHGRTEPVRSKPESLHWEPDRYDLDSDTPQWAMVIDLNVCTGCSACMVACQAENNIPSVGAAEVINGRLMHWIRMERYFEGPPEAPELHVQPVACQQCEQAPCEYVCPVNATVHSDDGLNEMVYNRCVGTRFCSSNCPYKARRFNWFDYQPDEKSPLARAMNPQVTVRDRGVMEKCTYCVQRIRNAPFDDAVTDVQTACQQACPMEAITFGSLTDAGSPIREAMSDSRTYSLLGELGTFPRTQYQQRKRNRKDGEPT